MVILKRKRLVLKGVCSLEADTKLRFCYMRLHKAKLKKVAPWGTAWTSLNIIAGEVIPACNVMRLVETLIISVSTAVQSENILWPHNHGLILKGVVQHLRTENVLCFTSNEMRRSLSVLCQCVLRRHILLIFEFIILINWKQTLGLRSKSHNHSYSQCVDVLQVRCGSFWPLVVLRSKSHYDAHVDTVHITAGLKPLHIPTVGGYKTSRNIATHLNKTGEQPAAS